MNTMIEGNSTISKLFRWRAQNNGNQPSLKEKDLGIWKTITWGEYYRLSQTVGAMLLELGCGPRSVVSILAENCKEWLFCDMANIAIGAITNGIYPTDAPQQVLYLLNDSKTEILFVENEEQLDKFLEIQDQLPNLKKVIVYDWKGLRNFSHPKVLSWDSFIQVGESLLNKWNSAWNASIDASKPGDIVTLVYTSGTTGMPKGAMVSHQNLMFQISITQELYPMSNNDRQISFLPLCHIAEKVITIIAPLHSQAIIHFVEETDTLEKTCERLNQLSSSLCLGFGRSSTQPSFCK